VSFETILFYQKQQTYIPGTVITRKAQANIPQISGSWRQTLPHFSDGAIFNKMADNVWFLSLFSCYSPKVTSQWSVLKFLPSNKLCFLSSLISVFELSIECEFEVRVYFIHRKWTCLGVYIAANQSTSADYVTPIARYLSRVIEIFPTCYKILI